MPAVESVKVDCGLLLCNDLRIAVKAFVLFMSSDKPIVKWRIKIKNYRSSEIYDIQGNIGPNV